WAVPLDSIVPAFSTGSVVHPCSNPPLLIEASSSAPRSCPDLASWPSPALPSPGSGPSRALFSPFYSRPRLMHLAQLPRDTSSDGLGPCLAVATPSTFLRPQVLKKEKL
ncbi:PREDICTED: uncharacterized protein LOC105814884, partial [Propithecus coquereli]|uniref:uncharacterized protein LOC105814884 n=1 Tax=Propithecus coquereli TaxID=379532 RepID=UPI00063F6244